jgi:aromatase
MSPPRTHRAVHSRVVAAPEDVAFDIVADVHRWPVIFGPSLFAEHLERGERTERFQLWALVNDEVKSWVSRRELDRAGRCVEFEQEHSQPPIAAMGGEWRFRPLPGRRTEVVLVHHFAAVDDAPDAVDWISRALDRNSAQELDALARIAELDVADGVDGVVLTFDDTVPVDVAAGDAYAFVDRADLWPARLPHVSRVALRSPRQGVQDMEMDTVTPDGATHTTRSVRLCFPTDRIVYKQLVPPALLFGHSGTWTFADDNGPGAGDAPGRALVTAEHTVAIDPAAVPEVLGPGATLADARTYVREALTANSRTTMTHAGLAASPAPTPAPTASTATAEGGAS